MNNQPLPFARQNELADLFVDHLSAEAAKVRARRPRNDDKLADLTKAAGELAQALLRNKHEKSGAGQVWREAVQVAAMALRVATEGSAEMLYRPEDALSELGMALRN